MSRMHAIVHAAAHLAPPVVLRQARLFGLGYGRSSGYGTPRSYAAASVPSRFRVA
ncbi:hypothetical protein [Luteimonas fraxinea]|uniref:hypothetical protein n=1 Tax=Luteimonas fraxinea TaxID=2901869 RepID=UPI001E43ACF5|nr:hypothetical protein [Luteimonas fraxinea]MCD9124830.1 hypothetical protein [Luteimonas fraxinea]